MHSRYSTGRLDAVLRTGTSIRKCVPQVALTSTTAGWWKHGLPSRHGISRLWTTSSLFGPQWALARRWCQPGALALSLGISDSTIRQLALFCLLEYNRFNANNSAKWEQMQFYINWFKGDPFFAFASRAWSGKRYVELPQLQPRVHN